MTTNLRSLLSLPLLAALAGLPACSDESSVTPDAAVETDSGTSPTDTPRTDAPTVDVPRADVPTMDAADVPSTDVPARDVPSTDVPARDVPAAGDACARPDIAPLTERIDCRMGGDGVCPAGYTCLSMSGIVLQQSCGRSCRADCECPASQRCGSYTDKAGTHPLCVAGNTDRR